MRGVRGRARDRAGCVDGLLRSRPGIARKSPQAIHAVLLDICGGVEREAKRIWQQHLLCREDGRLLHSLIPTHPREHPALGVPQAEARFVAEDAPLLFLF